MTYCALCQGYDNLKPVIVDYRTTEYYFICDTCRVRVERYVYQTAGVPIPERYHAKSALLNVRHARKVLAVMDEVDRAKDLAKAEEEAYLEEMRRRQFRDLSLAVEPLKKKINLGVVNEIDVDEMIEKGEL